MARPELLASSKHLAGALWPWLQPIWYLPTRGGQPAGSRDRRSAQAPSCVRAWLPLAPLSSSVLERRICTMPRTNTCTGTGGGKQLGEEWEAASGGEGTGSASDQDTS